MSGISRIVFGVDEAAVKADCARFFGMQSANELASMAWVGNLNDATSCVQDELLRYSLGSSTALTRTKSRSRRTACAVGWRVRARTKRAR